MDLQYSSGVQKKKTTDFGGVGECLVMFGGSVLLPKIKKKYVKWPKNKASSHPPYLDAKILRVL